MIALGRFMFGAFNSPLKPSVIHHLNRFKTCIHTRVLFEK